MQGQRYIAVSQKTLVWMPHIVVRPFWFAIPGSLSWGARQPEPPAGFSYTILKSRGWDKGSPTWAFAGTAPRRLTTCTSRPVAEHPRLLHPVPLRSSSQKPSTEREVEAVVERHVGWCQATAEKGEQAWSWAERELLSHMVHAGCSHHQDVFRPK